MLTGANVLYNWSERFPVYSERMEAIAFHTMQILNAVDHPMMYWEII